MALWRQQTDSQFDSPSRVCLLGATSSWLTGMSLFRYCFSVLDPGTSTKTTQYKKLNAYCLTQGQTQSTRRGGWLGVSNEWRSQYSSYTLPTASFYTARRDPPTADCYAMCVIQCCVTLMTFCLSLPRGCWSIALIITTKIGSDLLNLFPINSDWSVEFCFFSLLFSFCCWPMLLSVSITLSSMFTEVDPPGVWDSGEASPLNNRNRKVTVLRWAACFWGLHFKYSLLWYTIGGSPVSESCCHVTRREIPWMDGW